MKPSRVELLADRADAPVHHVRGRDHVGAGARVADGGAGQQLERRVVVDRRRPRAARRSGRGSVYSHRHTSVITSSSGTAVLDRARRQLHDALLVPGAGALLVLLAAGTRTASPRRAPARRPRGPPRRAADSDRRSTPGIEAIGSRPLTASDLELTNSGSTSWPARRSVSRTSPRRPGARAQPAHARLWKGHRPSG